MPTAPLVLPSPLGIRQTSEGCWLAWIKSKATPGTPLEKANFFPGQSTEEVKLPAVVVAVNGCRELMGPGSGYWEVDLDFLIMSSPDGGADADAFQAALVGQIEASLYGTRPGDTESIKEVAAEVMAMPGFYYSIHGFWIEEQTGQAVEQHWIDQFRLKVHCAPVSGVAAS